jgi:hypothetical protein
MLFPNHPAYAEIRPGMGLAYMPGANALGYQPGAHALLGYHSGAHGNLGDFSSSMESAAVDSGYSQSDLDLLNSLGATDQDLENLINKNITLTALYAEYGVTIPSGSTATANSSSSTPIMYNAPPQGPSPAAAGQVPTGSQVHYVAGWSPIHGSISDVQSALSTKLPSYGMQLVGFSSTGSSLLGIGTAGFTAQVAITGVGFALLSDVQSILVTIVQSVIGTGHLTTNEISLVSTPSTPVGTTPASDSSPLAWIENNAIYIAGAVAALVLLNNFTGGKRR